MALSHQVHHFSCVLAFRFPFLLSFCISQGLFSFSVVFDQKAGRKKSCDLCSLLPPTSSFFPLFFFFNPLYVSCSQQDLSLCILGPSTHSYTMVPNAKAALATACTGGHVLCHCDSHVVFKDADSMWSVRTDMSGKFGY